MQRTASGPRDSKLGFGISLSRFGYLTTMLLAAAVFLVPRVGAQAQTARPGTLAINIRPQIQLQTQGTDVVLKIRLEPGITAKLWRDDSCGLPTETATTIAASGTYTIAIQNLVSQGQAYVCAASSDGLLKDSIALQN